METTQGHRDLANVSEFSLATWAVLPASNQLRHGSDLVTLQNLSMQVLIYLANRQGQVVTYDDLLSALWQGRAAGEDAVYRRIADLRRNLGDDRSAPTYIETVPKKGYRLVAPIKVVSSSANNRKRYAIAASIILVGLALTALLRPDSDTQETRYAATIQQADAAISQREFAKAYLAIKPLLDEGLDDPNLERIRTLVTTPVAIESSPPSAMVQYKMYGEDESRWQPLGTTPLQAELPHGTWQLRLIADGYAATELAAPNPSRAFNNVNDEIYTVRMSPSQDVPDGLTFIPGGEHVIPLFNFFTRGDLGDFYIAETEVSNRLYQEFVDANGYQESKYWVDLEEFGLAFDYVAEHLADTTGTSAPASWINGRYPRGDDDLPVTGVSWYEASAYARFRGLKLPTARHWARAAFGIDENSWPLAPSLLPAANLDGTGPLPVSEGGAISTWGAVNLVGNVREWTTTKDNETRISVGLGFRGPEWAYAQTQSSLPGKRDPDRGIRLASYTDSGKPDVIRHSNLVPVIPEVSDAEYSEIESLFAYDNGQITPSMIRKESSINEGKWIREKLIIESESFHAPLTVLVFRPVASRNALRPVIYLPPESSYNGKFPSDEIDLEKFGVDFVVEAGHALVWPIIAGTHERFRVRPKITRTQLGDRWLRATRLRRAEIGATIDLLENDSTFKSDQITMIAASYGARMVASHILATERRIKAAALVSATLAPVDASFFGNAVNPNTHWPRVRIPVLVMNGRYDIAAHVTEQRDQLVSAIGSPAELKRSVLYESSAWPLPQHRVRNDTLQWFDQHLGKPASTLPRRRAGLVPEPSIESL